MTLSASLLSLSLALLAYFGVYWVGLNGLTLAQGWRRRQPVEPETRARGSVLALVPSHHEGAALIDTVRTLLAQDYAGRVSICVLVEDFEDVSVAALRTVLEGRREEADGRVQWLLDTPERQVRVVATGHRAKHQKLNFAIERFEGDFVAMLDADHRAVSGWLSSALTTLERHGAAGVQCRKLPLGADRLAQAWDALLSHTVFELFNQAAWATFGQVSFTGSTAVFRREVLAGVPFAECITEDTWLTVALTLAGHRIAYDPRVGSLEETTPNVPSFVLRRRRWAAGHTHAFFAHLRSLARSRLPWPQRLQAGLLGQFYLVPLSVNAFFFAQGLYYFFQFTAWVRALLLLLSALVALALTLYLSWRRRTKARDALVCWLAVAPHLSMAGAFFYRLFERETYYFLTSFPYQGSLWAVQGGLFALGLATVVTAWLLLRPTPLRDLLVFVVTSPLVVFFELLSTLLGLSDYALGHSEWSRIDRTNEYARGAVEPALHAQFAVTRERKRGITYVLWAALFALGVALANEVFSVGPCNEERALLWEPLFAARRYAPLLLLEVHKALADGTVAVDVVGKVPAGAQPRALRTFLDGALIDTVSLPASARPSEHHLRFSRPVGWESHLVRMVLSGTGVQCVMDQEIATSVVDASGRELRVNGEPFLVKGMVPTFSAPALGLSAADGYRQLQRVGVNAIRLYHPPTDALLAAARLSQLLIIAQPEQSSWDALDPTSARDRRAYERRWQELGESLDGFPFALMLNVGNELEIDDRRAPTVDAITRMIRTARRAPHQVPTTYSTFATFLDYPVEVLGINMLDSGDTYWREALRALPSSGRPFYASELGGFVAFYERPPTALRQWRLTQQWAALRELHASGAVFYSSNDNWAQAVPPGSFNDPWTPEMPDDRRGFWDERNQPKPELDTLAWLLADVDLEALGARVDPAQETVPVRVQNRRRYALRGVVLTLAGRPWDVGELAPEEARVVDLPLELLRSVPGYPLLEVELAFTSHAGLRGGGRTRLSVPDASAGLVPLSPQVHVRARSATGFLGDAPSGESLELIAPASWASVRVNGVSYASRGERLSVPLPAPMRAVSELEVSFDGQSYAPYTQAARDHEGLVFLRFRLPETHRSDALLLLQGLGATQVFVRWNDGATQAYPAHPYRETLIDLGARTGEVTVRMQRRALEYLRRDLSPTGQAIHIRLSEPVVFSPTQLDVRRGS